MNRSPRALRWCPGTDRVSRRGAVAVEFAVVAPLLVVITLGLVTVNRAFEAQNLLEVAAWERARFASMDRDGLVAEGADSNAKLATDVKNFLASNGIPREHISVAINDHENPDLEFDIDEMEEQMIEAFSQIAAKVPPAKLVFDLAPAEN